MTVRRFEDLVAWQKSKELALGVYRITDSGQFARDFPLRDQIRRAAISVMSNVAEGFERYSQSEFRQFLSIARGSVSEVRCQLYLARDLGYMAEPDFTSMYSLCVEISRLLAALRASTSSHQPSV